MTRNLKSEFGSNSPNLKIRTDNLGSQQKKANRLQLLSSLDLLTCRQGGDPVASTRTTAVVVGRRQPRKDRCRSKETDADSTSRTRSRSSRQEEFQQSLESIVSHSDTSWKKAD